MKSARSLWSFSRPHTIIGTGLSVCGLCAMAVAWSRAAGSSSGAWPWGELAWTLLACLLANVYIVGLNQLTDLDIDRVNKPHLPLASGALSLGAGRAIVAAALVLALGLAWWRGPWLTLTIGASVLIGSLYSLPPVRLKQYHFWAAGCILVVRGILVNLLIFLHFQSVFGGGRGAVLPAPLLWLTGFVVVFSVVIAWLKDIPDMEGDRRFAIRTLTLAFGPDRVFRVGVAVLAAGYATLVAAGLAGALGAAGGAIAVSHGLLLIAVVWRARRVEPADAQSMTRFYMFVWALFFTEYLVFPASVVFA